MKYRTLRYSGIVLTLLGSAIICFRTVLTEVLLNMDIGDWITIGGIVIGFLGVILGVTIPLRRDGKTIDSISADTTDMKPKVGNINSTISGIAEKIVRIEDRSTQISAIATAVESFKYLKENCSENTVRPEVLLASIASVFEENAQLRKQHQNDQQEILTQRAEINELRFRNQQLEAALEQQSPSWEP